MGREFVISSLEEMCALMCDNIIPEEYDAERDTGKVGVQDVREREDGQTTQE